MSLESLDLISIFLTLYDKSHDIRGFISFYILRNQHVNSFFIKHKKGHFVKNKHKFDHGLSDSIIQKKFFLRCFIKTMASWDLLVSVT